MNKPNYYQIIFTCSDYELVNCLTNYKKLKMYIHDYDLNGLLSTIGKEKCMEYFGLVHTTCDCQNKKPTMEKSE